MSDQPRRNRPPTITPRPDEKAPLTVLLPPTLKARIIAAAEQDGRSLSAEAEVRLETSFITEDLLAQTSRLLWSVNTEFVFLVGLLANKFSPKGAEWRSDDEAVRSIFLMSIARALTCLFDHETALLRFAADNPDKLAGIEDRTDVFLHALGDPDSEWARAKRERLGELGERLIAWHRVFDPYVQTQAKLNLSSDRAAQQPADPEAVAMVNRARERPRAETAEHRGRAGLARNEAANERRRRNQKK